MQHNIRSILGFAIRATDGDLGKVQEFYFDDQTWTIRYLVVETGTWLAERKVLISPVALGKPDLKSHTFAASLTCEQVRKSPDIDTERPVERQHEAALHAYYEWSPYWEGGFGGALGITPFPLLEEPLLQEPSEPTRHDDQHLRSTRHVAGYRIQATDGEIGHVQDFVIDDDTWQIRDLIVDTGNWFSGKKVLIAPAWVASVNWADASVSLGHTRETVRNSVHADPLKTT